MRTLAYIILLGGLASLMLGCAGVERSCHGDTCWLRAYPEQVDRHCRKTLALYDDGHAPRKGDGRVVRACTRKVIGGRYRVWLARGYEYLAAHEDCHLQEYRHQTNEHWKCDGEGFRGR